MQPEVRPGGAGERILDTAFRLFYAHGIRSVGVDRIIAESQVAKATFYKHFPSKDHLVVAYLDAVDRTWTAQLRRTAAAAGAAPARRLVGMFDALAEACDREGYRGCAFLNAAAEYEAGTLVHTRTLEHKDAVRAWVRDLAEEAGAADPDALARGLTLLLDGALASGSVDALPDAPAVAKDAARLLVAAATAAAESRE